MLLLSALLAPLQAQAASEALKWVAVAKPGEHGNLVVSPSEVSEIAVGRDGVLYVADSENSKFYRSLDAGVTWEDITYYLVAAGAELPVGKAIKMAIAPDKPGIVAVATNDGTKVYLSTDGGIDWADNGVPTAPTLAGTIQTIAISQQFAQYNESYREIAIATADWGNGTTTGQVWVRRFGGLGTLWVDQGLIIDPDPSDPDPSHLGGEVSALAYSPDFQIDYTLLVVASTGSDYATATYQNKTWLCLLNRYTRVWNSLPGYPVEIAPAGDAPGVSIISSLALPSDYSSDEAASRRLFISYNREPDTGDDDVYRFDDISRQRLNVLGGANIDICRITYYGTLFAGRLLAGDVNPVPGSLTVQVRRTAEPFELSPTWQLATVPPTGPGNAKVSWSPDGELAYCGTSQHPGVALDESALSASLDGDKWRQMGLIDTVIQLAEITPAPDSQSLFLTTYSPLGPEGIWRSAGDPLGWHWERLLTIDTASDAVILRLSPNYSNDYTMYAVEVGGNQMAVTHNRGNSWKWCQGAPGPVIDMAIADKETIYVALPGGNINRSLNGALTWQIPVNTQLPDINMLAVVDKGTILVGGRSGDVAYSADGGASFTLIREVIGSGSGDVQVAADVNYGENNTIYATTNIAGEGIWRWVIGVSTRWEQIDKSITGLGAQCIGGLATGPEGTLYALRMEPATSASGGITRSLNPLETDSADIEFDLANDALPAGATFDPTPLFPTLPYLKLSGDAGQNELWTIDTTNQIIYRYQDTLCKLGPTLEIPEAGEIIPIDASGDIAYLILKWQALAGVTEYESAIYRDADAIQSVWSETSDVSGITAVGGAGAANLGSGITYYWRVRAIEPVKSPWSEMWSFNPALGAAQWSPLAVPAGVSPSPGATNVPIRPPFAWQPGDLATAYEFMLARDSEFTSVVVAMTGANALPTPVWGCDRDLDYSTTYFWRVRAINATGCSEWGTGVFTTRAAPSAPLPSPPSPTLPSESTPAIPPYLVWIAIGIGVMLFVVLLVFIVRTAR